MNNNIKVLFFYDLQSNVEMTAEALKKQGFNIKYDHANTCFDMLDRLHNNSYDLIISEYNLSSTNVMEALSLLSENYYEVPLVIMADTYNERDMLNAFKAGCSDYLVRSDVTRLRAIVLRITCEAERQHDRKKTQKQCEAVDVPVKNAGSEHSKAAIMSRDVTKLREIEKELREEKIKLSAIFEATPVGLVILDENLIVKRVNLALANLLGKSVESMINNKLGDSFSCVCAENGKGCKCGSNCNCEFCNFRSIASEVNITGISVHGKEVHHSLYIEGKKEDVWFRVNSVPILIHGSRHIILAIDDITQNKRSEEALLKSRDFYLKLFEDFPALIWRSGLDAKCNYFNRSWLELTGHTLEEEYGDGWAAGVHPDDLEMCFKTYIDAFNAQRSFDMEYRLRRHDGEYRWISDSGRPFYDAEGAFSGYIGFCLDITEKKQELELMSKYQLLSKHANDIILFIDEKGNILEINEAGLQKYGYSREEFKTLTISDLRKVDGIYLINEHLNTVWARSIMFDTMHYKKDGSSFPVEVSWSGAEIGNKRKILCVVRDITERMLLHKYLEDKNEELHDVVERLKETQRQLIQQEQFAAILAAGVAHEINNPLGFTISNLETLKKYCSRLKEVVIKYSELKEAVTADVAEELKRILEEVDELNKRYHVDSIKDDIEVLIDETNEGLHRIKKIVKGLRVFSRVDNTDDLIDYNINEGIENSIMVANNEIKYYADIEKNYSDISTITLPGNQINQVLLNIIINAVHAIKQNGQRGLIKISTYEDNGYVCCDIEDNGMGIPEENLNKIFNPFFTTKPVGEGTGLGLSISYDIIVNKYNGEMTVKSTLGKGTIFTIKLPIKYDTL